mmetsp:Transcript_10581/g.35143  ORF Transcript_10581/g.35143 Transcript_10581/m.35143 type:complete len:207 (+) Transcript_10581:1262-1882(+)|eukprot:scaffold25045_cov90-Isochrysis_galbana.AAC.2
MSCRSSRWSGRMSHADGSPSPPNAWATAASIIMPATAAASPEPLAATAAVARSTERGTGTGEVAVQLASRRTAAERGVDSPPLEARVDELLSSEPDVCWWRKLGPSSSSTSPPFLAASRLCAVRVPRTRRPAASIHSIHMTAVGRFSSAPSSLSSMCRRFWIMAPKSGARRPSYRYDRMERPMATSGCAYSDEGDGVSLPTKGTAR